MSSLEQPWLLVLHCIAMAEKPPNLDALIPITSPKRRYRTDYRAAFRQVADGLLSSGVLLVQQGPERLRRRTSRFECLVFRLPEVHRAALPPFPVPTRPLGDRPQRGRAVGFCLKALQTAAASAGSSQQSTPDGLLGRMVSAIHFDRGELRLAKATRPNLAAFMRELRARWAGGQAASHQLAPASRVAEHILSHLPAGEGVTVEELQAALAALGHQVAKDRLGELCADGQQAGLLARGGNSECPCYRAVPDGEANEEAAPLAFDHDDRAIQVDLERTGLAPLLELASVSHVKPAGSKLRLSPDIVALGRIALQLESIGSLQQIRACCRAFDEAVEHVERKHGKLLLHEGLVILRVEDLGLRTLLSHHLGASLRSLGGPYLAAPQALLAELEKLARKEGFSPRTVSAK